MKDSERVTVKAFVGTITCGRIPRKGDRRIKYIYGKPEFGYVDVTVTITAPEIEVQHLLDLAKESCRNQSEQIYKNQAYQATLTRKNGEDETFWCWI